MTTHLPDELAALATECVRDDVDLHRWFRAMWGDGWTPVSVLYGR